MKIGLFVVAHLIGIWHASAAVEFRADSKIGRQLLSQAKLEGSDEAFQRQLANNDGDNSFLQYYALKFQGCHHVQQWNDEADEEDEVRIRTKRLARFRLCPADQCNSDKSVGCTSKFGDYVVDLNTFVSSYFEVLEEQQEEMCSNVYGDCAEACGEDGQCMQACYSNYGLSYCWNANYGNDDDNNNGGDQDGGGDGNFDAMDYGYCAQFDMPENNNNNNNNGGRRRRLEDGQKEYYIGPFCADQGGEIHLGLFTDETCTTFAQYGDDMFYNAMGFSLPYSDTSLVSTRCLSCADGGDGNNNNGNNYGASEQCSTIYSLSGKCETRMDIDYPNESSCSYIEGIKIIREDGVIRTSTTKKSKTAAVAIGLFMTLAVLLGGYVYYLRTKLSRAQINLAAAAQPLT